jgi:hypothetical protein
MSMYIPTDEMYRIRKIPKGINQKPCIEEGQTTQWQHEKGQTSTKHYTEK